MNPEPVPMLPAAPPLERWLLESPWMLMGVLVLLGIIAFITLSRRGQSRPAAGALILSLVLAGLAFAAATLITTGRERLQQQTRDLVASTAAADTGKLSSFLEPGVRLILVPGLPAVGGDRDTLLQAVSDYPGRQFPIREHSTSAVQAVVDGPNTARTQLRVWVRLSKEQAFYDAPIGSWWRLAWRRDPGPSPGQWGPWRVTSIEMLQLDGFGRSTGPGR